MIEKDKNEKLKRGIIFGLLVSMVVAVFGGITYAFFTTSPTGNKIDANLTSGTASMRFADNDDGISATLDFGESITKKFILENTGTVDLVTKISWRELVNTYLSNSLTYTLSYSENDSETAEGYIEVKTSYDNIPPSTEASKQDLADGIILPAGKTYYFLLTITLNSLDYDQTSDLNATFSSKFMIEDGSAGFWDKILMNVKDGDPDFNNLAPLPITYKDGVNDGFDGSRDTLSVAADIDYKENYFTYADEYEYDVYTSKYSLINPKSCQYKDCYEELRGKYVVTPWSNSTTDKLVNYQSLSGIYKVKDETTLDKMYYTSITREPLSYNYSEDGIYTMEDDYGTSYYYRGAVTNNYVKFGKNKSGQDMFWRIIRINGDGTLRMIYDGTQAWANGVLSSDRRIANSTVWTSYDNDNKYVGYMYGGLDGEVSTSLEQAQKNETDSNAKKMLDSWYESVFKDTKYEGYLADEIFCNDRSLSQTSPGTGFGDTSTQYGAYERIENGNPSLVCPQKNDAFTVGDTTKGNGALTYPIGLITADELMLAGTKLSNFEYNRTYYLNKGFSFWTMTPYNKNDKYLRLFRGGQTGILSSDNTKASYSLVPVINLKAEYLDMMNGSGSASNPYYIEDN